MGKQHGGRTKTPIKDISMASPLRILHMNLSSGGLGRYGALFARALSEQDDVRVLSLINPALLNSEPLKEILKNVEIFNCPVQGLASKARMIPALRKVIRLWKPDVIIDTAGSGYALGIIALWLVKGGVPWLVVEHDPEPHMGMGTSPHVRLARYLIRRFADHIFVHGPLGKKTLIDQGVAPFRITVIRLGRLDQLFDYGSAQEIQREPCNVLFFGALRPNKGVQLLIPIAEKLHAKYPEFKLIVAGSPKVARELKRSGWPRELRRLLEEMRRRPYFEVHDRFITDEEVASFFRRASITLLPYLDATQSGVAMIAMPFGSVVVATRVGDLPYTIQDGTTGLIAEPTVESIVGKLEYALAYPEELAKIRIRAKTWVENECNWDRIINQVMEIYYKSLQTET